MFQHCRGSKDANALTTCETPPPQFICVDLTHRRWAESVDSTPMNTAHTAQYSLFTSAERIARAWLKNCITSLCALEESVIWSAHVSPFVALPPAVHHEHIFFVIHSSFHHDIRTRTTIWTTRCTSRNTQYIIHLSKTSQSTSGAIKNHSGVKTRRVAETLAKHSPQVMSPKRLRLSQGSRG